MSSQNVGPPKFAVIAVALSAFVFAVLIPILEVNEPRTARLVLTFQLEDNEWRLIHAQNTRIDKN